MFIVYENEKTGENSLIVTLSEIDQYEEKLNNDNLTIYENDIIVKLSESNLWSDIIDLIDYVYIPCGSSIFHIGDYNSDKQKWADIEEVGACPVYGYDGFHVLRIDDDYFIAIHDEDEDWIIKGDAKEIIEEIKEGMILLHEILKDINEEVEEVE